MGMNFEALLKQAQASTLSPSSPADKVEGSKVKIVYPIHNGRIKFRLLPDVTENQCQRFLYRHKIPDPSNQYGSKNVPCIKRHYGQPCPICDAINQIENEKGKECGAYRKFGVKTRAICNAMITEIGEEYEDVKANDLVVMMYPKTVAIAIAKLIVDNAANVQSIVGNNGCPIVLETKTGANGIPEYAVSLDIGFGGPVFVEVKNSEQDYENFLYTLPSLDALLVTTGYEQETRTDAEAAADYIKLQYT